MGIRLKVIIVTVPCFLALFILYWYQDRTIAKQIEVLSWMNSVEEPISTEIYHLRAAFGEEEDAVLEYLQGLRSKEASNKILEKSEISIDSGLKILAGFPKDIPPELISEIRRTLKIEDELRLKLFSLKDEGKFKFEDQTLHQFNAQVHFFDNVFEKIHDRFTEQRKLHYQDLISHQTKEKEVFNSIFIFGLLFTFFVVLLVSHFFIKPLLDLTQTMQKIDKGDLSARTNVKSSDEIGILARAFNKMLDSLASVHGQLESAAKLSVLGEIAGNIAHEINNPLTTIIARTQRLEKFVHKDPLIKEELDKEISSIAKTSKIISKIIKSLKSFSRNSDRDPLEKMPIANILEDCLELVHEKYKLSNTQLKVDCDPKFVIHCHSSQIMQILVNLLGNSLDAVEKQPGRWVELKVDYAPSNNELVWMRVTDSGTGIPPEVLAQLNKPFFTTKVAGRGTGLGLTISRKIAENHGGRLFYEKNGENTSFIFELPLFSQTDLAKKNSDKNAVA